MKDILCFGDSNTWGWMPQVMTRYPADVRWTGVLRAALGEGYNIIEDGISGRLTVFEDLFQNYLNGRRSLPYALLSHAPLDLVILYLGTNDIKYYSAFQSSLGIEALISDIRSGEARFESYSPIFKSAANILVIAPTPLRPDILEINPTSGLRYSYEKSLHFAEEYRKIAELNNVHFLNAGDVAEPSPMDGVHLTPEGHRALGLAVADKVREILGE